MGTRQSRRTAVTVSGALAVALLVGLITWLLTAEQSAPDAARGPAVLSRADPAATGGVPGLAGAEAARTADVEALANAAPDADAAAAQAAASHDAAASGAEVLFTGRVVDEQGAPVAGAKVSHVPSYRLRKELGLIPDPLTYELAWEKLSHTTTAADGTFSLRSRDDVLAPETLPSTVKPTAPFNGTQPVLVVQHPDFVVRAHTCRTLEGSPHDAGAITLSPGATLVGRLLSEDGKALEGGHLAPARFSGRMEDYRVGNWTLGKQVMVARSGADGRFALHGLPSGTLEIEAEHPDCVPLRLQPELVAGEETDLGDLTLGRGNSIRGFVLGPDGNPLAGAKLLARAAAMNMGRPEDDSVLMEMSTTVYSTGAHEVRVPSAADGSFVAGTLNQSHYSIFADAPGREPACVRNVAAGATDVVLTLRPQATLLLTVVDAQSGEPIAGVHGEAWRRSGNEQATASGMDPELDVLEGAEAAAAAAVAPQGAAGAGLLLVQRAGPVRTDLAASAPGYATRGFVLPGVQPGEQLARTLKLKRESVLAGRVLDEAQQPIARAEVTLSPPQDARVELADRKATTDDAGVFRFGELKSGEWSLVAEAAGFVESAARPLFLAPEQARDGIDVVLTRAAVVRGVLLGTDGAPATGRTVNIRYDDPALGAPAPNLHTDADGRFVADNLAPGSVVVSSWPGAEARLVLVAGTESEVTLAMRRLPVVHGRVTAAGAPVPHAQVIALQSWGAWVEDDTRITASAVGEYELELPQTGSFTLAARPGNGPDDAPDESAWSRPAPITVDWEQRVLVDLAFAGGRLTGLVVDEASGKPFPHAGLQIHRPALDADTTMKGMAVSFDLVCQTDADGRYSFDRLVAGDYDITASAKGHAPSKAQGVTVAEGTATEAPRLALARGIMLTGTVRTASGKPLPPQLRVRLDPVSGPSHNLAADVQPDGTWSCGVGLTPGAWGVRLTQQHMAIFGGGEPEAALATAQVTLAPGETQVVDLLIND